MIFNCGPRGSGSSSGIDFGGKFNPSRDLTFLNNAIKDIDYKFVENDNKWELALLTSNSLKVQKLKESIQVQIFLIGCGEDGVSGTGNGGAGGNGGKYINQTISLQNGTYLYQIGDINDRNTIFNQITSENGELSGEGGRGGYAQGNNPATPANCNGKNGTDGVYAFGISDTSLIYPNIQFGGGGGGGAYRDWGRYNGNLGWTVNGSIGQGGSSGGGKGGIGPTYSGSDGGVTPNDDAEEPDNGLPNTGGGGGGEGVGFCYTEAPSPKAGGVPSTTKTVGKGGSGIIIIQGVK